MGQPGSGTAFYFADEKKVVIVANGIGELEPEETYQMWAIDDGQPVSIGLLTPDADGLVTMTVPFDASRADTFAVTIEPAGGSDAPTSDPVYTAQVRPS
jgi:anti-sigma-K factor RskA